MVMLLLTFFPIKSIKLTRMCEVKDRGQQSQDGSVMQKVTSSKQTYAIGRMRDTNEDMQNQRQQTESIPIPRYYVQETVIKTAL